MTTDKDILYGFCHCGCGQKTKIADRTKTARAQFTGEPMRYIFGHCGRKSLVDYIIDKESGCWEWQREKKDSGYGKVRGKAAEKYGTGVAHRIYYIRHRGPIPDGLNVCHHCDNPGCVNPDHLFLGTQRDNMLDCSAKGRIWSKTHPDAQRGTRNGSAKLTDNDVKTIRHLHAQGHPMIDIADRFPVSHQQIWRIIHRECWTHID